MFSAWTVLVSSAATLLILGSAVSGEFDVADQLPSTIQLVNASASCGSQGCDAGNSSAHLAIDGDDESSWRSSEQGAVTFTVHFENVFHVVSIILQDSNSLLPSHFSLLKSDDGEVFSPWIRVNTSLCPNGVTSEEPVGDSLRCYNLFFNGTQTVELSLFDGANSISKELREFTLATGIQLESESGFSLSEISVSAICAEISQPEQCVAPDTVRRMALSLPQEAKKQDVDLLWQERSDNSFIGAWYLNDFHLLEDCEGQATQPCYSAVLEEDFETVNNSFFFPASGGSVATSPCSVTQEKVLYFNEAGVQMVESRPTDLTNVGMVSFVVGFVSYPEDCQRESVVEFRYCSGEDDCRLLAVFTPGECGYCVDQILVEFKILQEMLNASLTLLTTVQVIVNETLLMQVEDEIQTVENATLLLEGTLTVLTVVLGSIDEVPPNINLLPSVVRYDQLLKPSLLELLMQIMERSAECEELMLKEQAKNISDVLQNILEEAAALELLFNAQDTNADNKLSQTENLKNLFEDFLNLTIEYQNEARNILRIITGRDYDDIMASIQSVFDQAVANGMTAATLNASAELNRKESQAVGENLTRIEDLIALFRQLENDTAELANRVSEWNANLTGIFENIQKLLEEAAALNSSIVLGIAELGEVVEEGEQLVLLAQLLLQNVSSDIADLEELINSFNSYLMQYKANLLDIIGKTEFCAVLNLCTPGQIHANMLFLQSREIVSLYNANIPSALEFLSELELLIEDLSSIIETALNAQSIANATLDQLSMVNQSQLLLVAQETFNATLSFQMLVEDTFSAARDAAASANSTLDLLSGLISNSTQLNETVTAIEGDLVDLESETDLKAAAIELNATATDAIARLNESEATLTVVEGQLVTAEEDVSAFISNFANATAILEETELKFDVIRNFINETRNVAARLAFNISEVIAENNFIIADIDRQIDSLRDIHDRISKINAPALFMEEEGEMPYISLQPPPGRRLGDEIVFEALDMYFLPSLLYSPPALLFYAGPILPPSQSVNDTEDFFAVVAYNDEITLRWKLGDYSDEVSALTSVVGSSEVFITRVGSKFAIQFGVNVGGLGEPVTSTVLQNNSLLFRTTNNTAFLLGGKPASFKLHPSLTDADSYKSFLGQFQLVLFNGQQWGIWDIRSTSPTAFTGSFTRNLIASNAIVQIQRQSSSVISFDGTGYLKSNSFAAISEWVDTNSRLLTFYVRPSVLKDSLVAFIYNEDLQISLEVAIKDFKLRVIFRNYETDVSFFEDFSEDLVGQEYMLTDLEILYSSRFNSFRLEGQRIMFNPDPGFFTNLNTTKAWFGGVSIEELDSPYAPSLSNGSYDGCIGLILREGSANEVVFAGEHYALNYLASEIQKGFSSTCLKTVYNREVGFDGQSHLAYSYLQLVDKANRVVDRSALQDLSDITYSTIFRPLDESGVIMVATDENNADNSVNLVMREGRIEVRALGPSMDVVATSLVELSLNAWHTVVIQTEFLPQQFVLSLYVDGVEHDKISVDSDFVVKLRTSAPAGVANPPPVFFLGGVNLTTSATEGLPNFRGCLKDFSYSFHAMSFLNQALLVHYPPGVSYNECPFDDDVVGRPDLGVAFVTPEIKTCFANPVSVLPNTHGGFHRRTQLITSNVLRMFGSTWTLGFSMKYSRGGHVVSIKSLLDHRIQLIVTDDNSFIFKLSTQDTEQMQEMNFTSTSFNVTITCSVSREMLQCSLMLGGTESDTLQVPYTASSVFLPGTPLAFGAFADMESFIGCIADLRIDNDSAGFNDLSTLVPCYENTEAGLGFNISLLATTLPAPSNKGSNFSLSFTPRRENGLLFVLTNGTTPIFAAGLFTREMRLSVAPFSEYVCSAVVCDPESGNIEHGLAVTYNNSYISATVDTEHHDFVIPPDVSFLRLYIGNAPEDYDGDRDIFRFLLSSSVPPDSPPAGFVGCVDDLFINSVPFDVNSADVVKDVYLGLCPTPSA